MGYWRHENSKRSDGTENGVYRLCGHFFHCAGGWSPFFQFVLPLHHPRWQNPLTKIQNGQIKSKMVSIVRASFVLLPLSIRGGWGLKNTFKNLKHSDLGENGVNQSPTEEKKLKNWISMPLRFRQHVGERKCPGNFRFHSSDVTVPMFTSQHRVTNWRRGSTSA